VKASGTPQVEPEIHNIVTLSSSNHFPSNRSNAKLAIELKLPIPKHHLIFWKSRQTMEI
jgi:hypothetical protein